MRWSFKFAYVKLPEEQVLLLSFDHIEWKQMGGEYSPVLILHMCECGNMGNMGVFGVWPLFAVPAASFFTITFLIYLLVYV